MWVDCVSKKRMFDRDCLSREGGVFAFLKFSVSDIGESF